MLDDLIRRQEKQKQANKDRYKLARGLGFNAYQARIMAGWSESRIREAAGELNRK